MECMMSQSLFIKCSHFVFAGDSCFELYMRDLVLVKELSQEVLANAQGALIVILEVKKEPTRIIELNSQASELSGIGRKSRATVKIPVLGPIDCPVCLPGIFFFTSTMTSRLSTKLYIYPFTFSPVISFWVRCK